MIVLAIILVGLVIAVILAYFHSKHYWKMVQSYRWRQLQPQIEIIDNIYSRTSGEGGKIGLFEKGSVKKQLYECEEAFDNFLDFCKSKDLELPDECQQIREEIEKHDFKNITESKDIDSVANELMKRFNEKYGNELTEEEKTVVKELSESNNKEEVFNKYKEVCTNKINEAKENYQKTGDMDSANKLSSIMEQVSKKVYVEETVENDICNFIEITSIF